ncbi:MAG: GDP-mannose 4,6-dehydratase [Acidimicrobiales bacterium]
MPHALITGVCGQDGSYLAEFLLERDYQVTGLTRRVPDRSEAGVLDDRVEVLIGDVAVEGVVADLVTAIRPDELYNLAAPSFVPSDDPIGVAEATALGAARILDAVARHHPRCRLYQASSSELFGHPAEVPQTETTPFRPRSPYGAAKLHAHWLTVIARDVHGLHASSGILYNHESPRRGLSFVTRRITNTAARIASGERITLTLGDLDARRDWGFAGDYVEAMWAMVSQSVPDDYVICTGTTHSVSDVCEVAFSRLGLDWRDHVARDPDLARGDQHDVLVGDPTKARERLGWSARMGFEELIETMVDADVERVAASRPANPSAP